MRLRKVLENHLLLARKQQKDFAQEIGWPESSLSRFLNGKSVSQEHLAKLICWLLTDETPKVVSNVVTGCKKGLFRS